VALKPESGRKHQLRFHMAEMVTAIVGDRKYTCDREVPIGLADGLHLHARALRLPPARGGAPIEIIADLPEHMNKTFDVLGFDASAAPDPFFHLKRMRRR
jgi:23S rRNA pseudouridine955/2504/2580 synthase